METYIKRDAFIAWLKRIPIKDLSDGLGLCRIIMEEDFKRAIRELPEGIILKKQRNLSVQIQGYSYTALGLSAQIEQIL